MRPRPRLALALASVTLATFVSLSCGEDGSSRGDAIDLSDIPTATLPSRLPVPIIVGGPGATAEATTYTVRAGDTLASIAARFGTTVEALLAANAGVDPERLEVGQVLTIPGDRSQGVLPATVAPTPTPSGATTYTVQSGDTPASIAARFGTTVEALLAANAGVDPTRLEVGQVLIIPPPSATPAP